MSITILQAEELCKLAHKGQTRRGGSPYHLHPMKVSSMLDTTDEKIIALLHDVVEDTSYTFQQLQEQGLTSTHIDALLLLTHTPGISYEDYIWRVATNLTATKVKIADMFHNISDTPTDRQRDKYMKSLSILLSLL
jgi:(p)ppGpp synthase/HD superfamily hydrolase